MSDIPTNSSPSADASANPVLRPIPACRKFQLTRTLPRVAAGLTTAVAGVSAAFVVFGPFSDFSAIQLASGPRTAGDAATTLAVRERLGRAKPRIVARRPLSRSHGSRGRPGRIPRMFLGGRSRQRPPQNASPARPGREKRLAWRQPGVGAARCVALGPGVLPSTRAPPPWKPLSTFTAHSGGKLDMAHWRVALASGRQSRTGSRRVRTGGGPPEATSSVRLADACPDELGGLPARRTREAGSQQCVDHQGCKTHGVSRLV